MTSWSETFSGFLLLPRYSPKASVIKAFPLFTSSAAPISEDIVAPAPNQFLPPWAAPHFAPVLSERAMSTDLWRPFPLHTPGGIHDFSGTSIPTTLQSSLSLSLSQNHAITHPNYLFLLVLPLFENYSSFESQQKKKKSQLKNPQMPLRTGITPCCDSHCVDHHIFALPLLCVITQHGDGPLNPKPSKNLNNVITTTLVSPIHSCTVLSAK